MVVVVVDVVDSRVVSGVVGGVVEVVGGIELF